MNVRGIAALDALTITMTLQIQEYISNKAPKERTKKLYS